MSKTIFTNAAIVLPDEVIHGSVTVEAGEITDISSGGTQVTGAHDLGGDYLMPGMVELHTDNLERHIQPRPKVAWPHMSALIAHDAELAAAGITTVFDAMRVGSILSGQGADYGKYARQLATELLEMREKDVLRISHFLHLRAEICSETLLDELDEFGPEDRVRILSLMDHTPGQRQFRDISKLKEYVCGKHGLSDAEFEQHVDDRRSLSARLGAKHEAGAVAAAARLGAVMASHDDTTAEQARVSARLGVRLAEFPTTEEAARESRAQGLATIMGGPNLVRGGSHSGNVAASVLAEKDLLDIVSSDYIPGSLLAAGVMLGDLWDDMARGIKTVTANPARFSGLDDRGEVRLGARADLLRMARIEGTPVVRETWVRGRRVC
ncbi:MULTISPECIES: alpha-D-ribose 1-methylphosphonate 5-triphosphate diphosphatase [Roseovarius]|jgi:alpha-D-ribose 1-methylphosphonate 5-triphosphate diphosphatase|uniref:Phosphonate metabolism protein PhnM n=1 Tax=Roseovarius nubinhibens TaxID=314263 RepID=A0A348W829_9RHOB|nr:alpha-D-ribose 1-methylphosphonate 5-triphosphate diphosphatase [Roseovarius sp.]MAZ20074.1 phosphonate metabolism protein PhnM [Roseovarius sp.]HAR50691.1 phosphonate metabolism protein PhnM [Roseovarius nubinhibens]